MTQPGDPANPAELAAARMRRGSDIAAAAFLPPKWDPKDPAISLNAAYEYVENQSTRAIGWYYRSKGLKQSLSFWYRLLAIVSGAIGGIIPILSAYFYEQPADQLQFNQWGYVAIALAAFWISIDRFTGSSTGWMRYIGAAMAMETLQAEFRADWTLLMARASNPPAPEQVTTALERLKTFTLAIRSQVEKETNAWITEFQANLAQIQKQTQQALDQAREEAAKQAERIDSIKREAAASQRNGAVRLEVTVSGTLDSGFSVDLDGKQCRQGITGTTCGIGDVAPGLREVAVRGSVAGKSVHASTMAEVAPNQIKDVKLSI